MGPSLYCKVCNQDHSKPLAKWCDRSDLEIKYDQVWDEYIKLTKALEVAEEKIQLACDPYRQKDLSQLASNPPRNGAVYDTQVMLQEALSQIEKIKKGE